MPLNGQGSELWSQSDLSLNSQPGVFTVPLKSCENLGESVTSLPSRVVLQFYKMQVVIILQSEHGD
jgi:hypothetical protein